MSVLDEHAPILTQETSICRLPNGTLYLPVYLPDATLGVVRAVDSRDLDACLVQAVVMNTFHLMQRPGSSTIRSLGGLHRMSGWPHPIITDSGGFQAYSLIRSNPKNGQLTDKGIIYRPEGQADKVLLTPEKTIQLQFSYGADILVCLDDCTHPDDAPAVQEESVRRTIAWARRCKKEFDLLLEGKELPAEQTPRLFAVIQGGRSLDLRRQCTQALLEIGFDGYGFGGWPITGQGELLEEEFAFIRQLVPHHLPLHALGVGHPKNVQRAASLGWELFDSAMPTRDARHGRLYVFVPHAPFNTASEWLDYVHIEDKRHIKSNRPLEEACDCLCCQNYTTGYLHHLFKINDSTYSRLATIHNLRFMTRLTRRLQG